MVHGFIYVIAYVVFRRSILFCVYIIYVYNKDKKNMFTIPFNLCKYLHKLHSKKFIDLELSFLSNCNCTLTWALGPHLMALISDLHTTNFYHHRHHDNKA